MAPPIVASRLLPYPQERVFAFLADLRNHWQLEDAFIELNGLRGNGGRISIRGPLGLSREARTTVAAAEPPSRMSGRAEIGDKTVGSVAWVIEPTGSGCRVTLSARVARASALDRALLALGGRRWLSRRFDRVLETLGRLLA